MKQILLFFLLLYFSFVAFAEPFSYCDQFQADVSQLNTYADMLELRTTKDTITFTWRGFTKENGFIICSTSEKEFTVDWGDGSKVETYIGKDMDDVGVTPLHTYGDKRLYTVTIAGVESDCFINYLCVFFKSVTDLDVTKAPELVRLECDYNEITTLDLSKNTKLRGLECRYNRISLVDLKRIGTLVPRGYIGMQNLPGCIVTPGATVPVDTVFNGVGTVFDVTKNGGLKAKKDTDYTVVDGKFTFLTKGVYRVEITHPDLSELTKVVASYIVGTVPTDQFTFTWEGGVDKEFEVSLKDHNSFIVDWGDGSDPETYINLSVQETSVKHAYSDARPYTVTVTGIKPDCFFKSVNVGGYSVTALDVTALPALLTLECYGNRLTELDLSKNTMLTELNCQANKLTALDINKNKKLVRLKCYDNAIPLVDMKAASNRIDIAYYKQLGTQTLPGVSVSVGSSVVIDSVYNGTGTTFTVTKDFGKPLVEGNDYTLESGVITFLSNGIYTVKLTNLAITSNSEKPAQVVYNYFVGTESKQQLTFTWRGSVKAKKMNIRLNHGNEIEVNWGDGTVENYIHTHTAANNAESFYIIPAHTYNDLKIYTVTLTGLTSDCFFQCFWMYDTSVVSLDINAPSLRELLCEPSQLTQLDVSNNPALIFLSCRGSQLTSLNITEAPQLRSLYCEGNRLTELDLTHLPELEDLACQNNRLLNLNLSHNPALNFLHCQNNAISLAGLKGISDKMGNNPNCRLGTQTIPDINVARGRAVPMDTVFYGNGTVFTVSRQDGTVAENADYTIKNGKITFLSEGTYTVEISNPAIDLYYNSAKVVATYHVRTLDSDASLKSLNVSDGTLAPTFVAETVNYTVNVGYEVESITITATPTHESATVSGDLDKYTLLVGENILKITVTAEDGVTEKVYTVKVVRANKDNNAFLSFTTFTAANGALSSPYRIISLSFGYTGDSPTHYMVSERADFSGAVWEIYVDEPFYTFITDAYGEKTLYAKLKNTVTPETKVLSTSLYYKAGPEKRPLDAFGTRVYPNPVVNNLNVSMEGEEQSAEVTIYTITGSVWQHRSYQGQQFTIDLSNAPSGVLLVKISNREGEVIKRILKQ